MRKEIARLYGRKAVSYEYFYRYYVDKRGYYKRCALRILDSLCKNKTCRYLQRSEGILMNSSSLRNNLSR
jgi:hypothetical protein